MTANPASFIEFFDSVRIINLPARADRRAETSAEFAARRLPLDDRRTRFFAAIAPEEAAGFPNRGVRGCFLSHLSILRDAGQHGSGQVLILEDDIAFARNLDRFGPLAVRQLAELNWDIAYLGHALGHQPGEAGWRPVDRPMLLAHCYAVNGRILPRLVPFLERILERPPGHPDGGPMHYDGALATFLAQNPDVKAWFYSKNLGYQRPSRTDLHQVSRLDSNRLLRPFAGLYRGAKRLCLKLSR